MQRRTNCPCQGKYAATRENIHSDVSIHWRPKAACASVQSNQSLGCAHEENASLGIQNVPSEDSYQTIWMCRLIWIAAHTIMSKSTFSDVRAQRILNACEQSRSRSYCISILSDQGLCFFFLSFLQYLVGCSSSMHLVVKLHFKESFLHQKFLCPSLKGDYYSRNVSGSLFEGDYS